MKKLIFTLFVAMFTVATFAKTVYTVGSIGSDYATLSEAFAACTAADTDYEIQIKATTTEPATGATLANVAGRTVLVYPTVSGCAISGTITTTGEKAIVYINGADNVTIDGRLRNDAGEITGTTPDLIIENTDNSTAAKNATILVSGAAYFFQMRYCIIKSSTQAALHDTNNYGGVTIKPTDNSNANDMRCTIEYNTFTPSALGRPILTLMVTATNGVRVKNNNFENVVKSDGIRLANNIVSCEVTGNSFYETTTFTPSGTMTFINVTSNAGGTKVTNLKIDNNYIGGSAALCSGTMTKLSTAASWNLNAIAIAAKAVTGTSIKGNQIKNIEWTTTTGTGRTFYAINFSSSSDAGTSGINIIEENFIGNINYSSSSDHNLFGINHASAQNTTIKNNIINLGNDGCAQNIYGIRTAAVYAGVDNIQGISNIYYNTVVISGVTAGNKDSYALNSNVNTGTRDIRNNIFLNTRTGANNHYAAYLNYTDMVPATNTNNVTFTCDYNDYNSSNRLGWVGSSKTSLVAFQAATAQDVNSVATNPGITAGTTPASFKGTVALGGQAISGITTDYAGTARTEPTMGAYYVANVSTALSNTTQNSLFSVVNKGIAFGSQANVEVINFSGQTVFKGIANNQTIALKQGAYIVKAIAGNKTETTRIIIR